MTAADAVAVRDYTAVAVVVRRAGAVLLVGHRSPSGDLVWSLPAGQVEPFEDVLRTAERELHEETGLRLERLVRLAYVVHVNRPETRDRTVALVFEGEATGEVVVDDPDRDVVAAEFVDKAQAVERLERLPRRAMREPAIAFLEGRLKAGTFLSYSNVEGAASLSGIVSSETPSCDATVPCWQCYHPGCSTVVCPE